MAKQVIYRRGTTAEHANFVGANGEITVDTVKHVVIVHDGVTAGGFPLANASTITANISALTANAANQAAAITVLQANAATQSANIATLFANAAAQQANITAFTLASNSTVIFADIDGVRANVTAANVQIGLLYGNATIQSEAIALANANIIALQSSITAANVAIAGIVTGTTFVTQTAFANNLTAVNSAISTQGTTFATNVAVAGVTANVTAANVEISALQANIAAANVAINNIVLSPALIDSIVQTVGPIVTAGTFYSNSNLAGYLSSQNITSANASINTINANVAAANAAIQSLNANIGTLVAGAPGALDTLIELGNALGNNASFSATMVTWLSNITSNITAANGSITTLQTQVYANANVATYLPTYTGNIAGNIVKNGNVWTFGNTGTTTFPTGVTLSNARGPNTVNFTTAIDKSFQIETQTSTTGRLWNFGTDGNLTLPQFANINFANGVNILSTVTDLYANAAVQSANIATINNTLTSTNVAIGYGAGQTNQGGTTVAVGSFAGMDAQGLSAVAIGFNAGQTTQGIKSVAIGMTSGYSVQGNGAVAIGDSAGYTNQGAQAIAIGRFAGLTNQANNTIILNATGANLDQTTANTLTVAPVRNDVANVAQVMFYNTTSKEITYGNTISVAGNINAAQYNFANGVSILAGIAGAYGNTQVAAYLPTYTGNITAGNLTITGNLGQPNRGFSNGPGTDLYITAGHTQGCSIPGGNTIISGGLGYSGVAWNGGNVTLRTGNHYSKQWNFDYAGTTTFPTNISIDYSGGNVQYPRIIADTGKAFSVQAQGNIGSAALSWTVDPDSAGQYAAVAVTKVGGDNLAKVILQAQSDSGNVATAKTWQFNETGNLRLPLGGNISEVGGLTGAIRLTPAGGANSNQALVIYPTGAVEGDHLHLTAGGGATELYLGNDLHYVKLVDGGNIELRATTANVSAQASWEFDTTGNVDARQALGIKIPNGVPTNVAAIASSTGSWELNPMSNLATTGGSGTGLTVNVTETGGYASTIEIATAGTGYNNGDFITVVSGTSTAYFTIVIGGRNTWRFGTDAKLTLPNGAVIKDTAFDAIAFGQGAGQISQDTYAVAIGTQAGYTTQNVAAVAVGSSAGQTNQGASAVAIGSGAGVTDQSGLAVAIGQLAGSTTQGVAAIAIGSGAGRTSQGNYSIILNATGANLNATTANTFTVAPVRNDVANVAQVMFYNTTSKEITYGNTISIAGNITAGNVSAVNFVGAIQAQVGSSFAYSLNAFGAGSDTGGVFLPADINSNAVVAGYTIVSSAGVTLTVTSATFVAGTPNFVQVATTPTASSFLYPVTVYSDNYSPAVPTSTITVGNATVTGNITAGNVAGTTLAGNLSGRVLTAIQAGITTLGTLTNVNTSGNVNATNTVTAGTVTALGNVNVGNTVNTNAAIVSGNITAGNISVAGRVTFADATYQTTAWTGVANTYVALGTGAGGATQNQTAVAIGVNAGNVAQDYYTVAIGIGAGRDTQLAGAIAIGAEAGGNSQGTYGIAIGFRAGRTNQANNSIILNATGANLNATTTNTLTVAPVRNDTGNVSTALFYNTTTKEITTANIMLAAFTMSNHQQWTSNVSTIGDALNQLAARLAAAGY